MCRISVISLSCINLTCLFNAFWRPFCYNTIAWPIYHLLRNFRIGIAWYHLILLVHGMQVTLIFASLKFESSACSGRYHSKAPAYKATTRRYSGVLVTGRCAFGQKDFAGPFSGLSFFCQTNASVSHAKEDFFRLRSGPLDILGVQSSRNGAFFSITIWPRSHLPVNNIPEYLPPPFLPPPPGKQTVT